MIDHIDLGQDLERFVHELSVSDRFASVDAMLRESVRLLEVRERKLAELNAAIDEGLADAHAGRLVPADEVFDRIERRVGVAKKAG